MDTKPAKGRISLVGIRRRESSGPQPPTTRRPQDLHPDYKNFFELIKHGMRRLTLQRFVLGGSIDAATGNVVVSFGPTSAATFKLHIAGSGIGVLV